MARGVGMVTQEALYGAKDLLGDLAPAVSAPGMDFVGKIFKTPGLGLAAGATTGLGLAYGAIWGQEQVDTSKHPLWKKILLKPALETYNQGIRFRQELADAKGQTDFHSAFAAGGKAGFKVGAAIGKTAGSVQGGVTGAMIGWQLSGEALNLLDGVLQGVALPPLAKQFMPLAVGATCLVLGQSLGSAAGGLIGTAVGGSLVGLSTGAYSALSRQN